MTEEKKKAIEHIDSALTKLPFDGDKTTISAGLALILPSLLDAFPSLLFLAPQFEGFVLVGLGLGLFHKLIKAIAR